MMRLRIFAVTTLFLLSAAFAWSQAEPRDDAKPQQEQVKPEEEKPKDEKTQQQVKPNEKQEQKQDEKAREEAKPAHEEHAQTEQGEHAHPAGKSARIPDDKFKAHFGREHKFTATRVVRTTTVVAGQTNFVYGGYTFIILEPWPTGWVMTDDCYIDYIDGEYFLVDLVHPEFRVSLSVSM
jgi:hypothetical protein